MLLYYAVDPKAGIEPSGLPKAHYTDQAFTEDSIETNGKFAIFLDLCKLGLRSICTYIDYVLGSYIC